MIQVVSIASAEDSESKPHLYVPDVVAATVIFLFFLYIDVGVIFPSAIDLKPYGGVFPTFSAYPFGFVLSRFVTFAIHGFFAVALAKGCRWCLPVLVLAPLQYLLPASMDVHGLGAAAFISKVLLAVEFATFIYCSLRLFGTLGPKSEDFLGLGLQRKPALADEE